MDTKTHKYTSVLAIVECAACHMDFGLLPRFRSDRRSDHETFYCPAGHENYYAGQSEEERLRSELAAQEGATTSARAARDRARAERDYEKRRNAALRGHLTRMRKRIAEGICPVAGCKRSGFKGDRMHMHLETKHSDWLAEHAHEIEEITP